MDWVDMPYKEADVCSPENNTMLASQQTHILMKGLQTLTRKLYFLKNAKI